MPVKILIVDDHDVLREGVRALINRERPRWEICGEAKSAQEAVEECRKLQPNVTVLDITMPGMSGLEVASSIFDLGSRVLMFTMHESDHVTVEVSQAGAQGYVLKSQAGKDLIRGIERILGGGTFFGSESEPQENATTGKRSAEKIAESSSGGRILSLLPEVQPPVLVGAKVVHELSTHPHQMSMSHVLMNSFHIHSCCFGSSALSCAHKTSVHSQPTPKRRFLSLAAFTASVARCSAN